MPMWVLLAALALAPQAAPADSLVPPNAFAGFEVHDLDNGLKVWYRRLPEEPVVSISVALPIGSDADPRGKEQLAHFTEHMLFSDQPGRNEEEIRREIEERGGIYNASVTAARTFYFVRIGKEHALFALEWLYRILAPHQMDPQVVERQRVPVALEIGAQPRQLIDWLAAYYLNPPWLRLPGFWEREFGIETLASRDYYPYASLNRITAEDLRWFYQTYYPPALMTLTVIGDIDREAILKKIGETFATLTARPAPDPSPPLKNPSRYRKTVFWAYRPTVLYSNHFKFYDMTAAEEIKLIFVSHLLEKRLNDRLRFGERKATYGIGVGIVKRGRAAYLRLSGGIKKDEFEFARGVVEDELEALRSGALPPEDFEADRAAVARQLRVSTTAAEDLERWVSGFFYDRRAHREFPDLAAAFDGVSKPAVESFIRTHFVPQREVLLIIKPLPVAQWLLALLIAALVSLSLALARRRLTRPVNLTRIRYVARFKLPRLYRILYILTVLLFLAVTGRTLVFAYQVLTDRVLLTTESFLVQWSGYAAMLVVTVLLTVLVLAHIPRKLLLFDDQIVIKHLSYRSVALPGDEIEELSLRRFRSVWLSRRILKCVPLTLGLLAPGVYLKRRNGWAYFFNVRDREEMLSRIREVLAGRPGVSSEAPQVEG